MRCSRLLAAVICLGGLVGGAIAQDTAYRQTDNPYQEDLEYQIGDDLRPQVEIDRVRWLKFAVKPKVDNEIDPTKDEPVFVELEFENRASEGASIHVIVLFEDENGAPLDRLECKSVKASGDRIKESSQKFKVLGRIIQSCRRIYLFCEVER